MTPDELAKRFLSRIREASLPEGAVGAAVRLEAHLKRLAANLGDTLPDSPAAWLAMVEYCTDRASVEARLQVGRETNPPSYQGYLRICELIETAKRRKAQGCKPYEC